MEREDENYSEAAGEPEGVMVDYVVEEHGGVDRALSFADVMQFADFGPKLGLHPIEDAVNFLKFPVLNNQLMDGQFMYDAQELENNNDNGNGNGNGGYNNPVQLEFMGNSSMTGGGGEKIGNGKLEGKNTTKKKRPRCTKTNEEVESQRMTHIAVERNRRKQMNEHLRVLRSLMPTSYVQRGDQASIIGGAIEFVRELEQLLQCLESQKRRRLYGDQGGQTAALGFPSTEYEDDELRLVEMDPTSSAPGLLWEDNAESKSSIADVEVKMSGLNALIKILSRRRPGQLIKIIADLEQLQFTILHTNITTIEQTVLYSFNVQVSSEARFTAQDVASSVQQIFSFIHANTNII